MFFGEYDYATDIAVQRQEEHEIGFEEGERNAKVAPARNLLRLGLSAEQVAEGVGLPVADVLVLANQL